MTNDLKLDEGPVGLTSGAGVFMKEEDLWRTLGYWRQRADERFGDPPLRWIQEPSVVRDRDGRPPRGPPGSALLLCV